MNTLKYLRTLCVALAVTGLTASCSDDNKDGGCSTSSEITVSAVYLENASDDYGKTDRLVEFARLGQHIRVQGAGFTGLKYIYVNGYETYFNNALMTDNNVWFTLNSKTPIYDADPDVRNTIQFVKDNETFTYTFEIRSASPSITSFFNSLPQAGETVTVYGSGLQETESVTLPSGTVITDGITSDEDGEWFTFTMPANETVGGSIVSVGTNGTAKSPAYFNDNSCYIINYDGLGNQGSWSSAYASDQLADDPLNSGRGKCAMLVPQSVLDEGGIKAGANSLYWATAGSGDDTNDWTRMTSTIPASTPIANLAIQFDIYCPQEWNGTGQLQVSLVNNLSNHGWGNISTGDEYPEYAYAWVPWLNEEDGSTTAFTTGEHWQTITLPLSEFGTFTEHEDYTFQDVIDIRNSMGTNNMNFLFELTNKDVVFSEELTLAASTFALPVYIDNLRLVNIETFTVSDFTE